MLTKDEKAYLNMLQNKKEQIEIKFRRLMEDYKKIEREQESILKNQNFHQVELKELEGVKFM